MLHRFKPFVAYTLIVLYSATMTQGQALHLYLGCGHDHDHLERSGDHECHDHESEEAALALSGDGAESHDSATCPVCQLLHQGQLSVLIEAPSGRPFIPANLPSLASSAVTVRLPGIVSPRGPPQV